MSLLFRSINWRKLIGRVFLRNAWSALFLTTRPSGLLMGYDKVKGKQIALKMKRLSINKSNADR
jgi:hypothetical protein